MQWWVHVVPPVEAVPDEDGEVLVACVVVWWPHVKFKNWIVRACTTNLGTIDFEQDLVRFSEME